MNRGPLFEERKNRYLESLEKEALPQENNWWQGSLPVIRTTNEIASQFPQTIDLSEPAVFKKPVKQVLVGIIIAIATGILLYALKEKTFGLFQVMFVGLLLLIVLPLLLNNKPHIIVNRTGIWLDSINTTIRWEHLLLSRIKELQREGTMHFLVVNYYDELNDQFRESEINLEGLATPAELSSAIEAFRGSKE